MMNNGYVESCPYLIIEIVSMGHLLYFRSTRFYMRVHVFTVRVQMMMNIGEREHR